MSLLVPRIHSIAQDAQIDYLPQTAISRNENNSKMLPVLSSPIHHTSTLPTPNGTEKGLTIMVE